MRICVGLDSNAIIALGIVSQPLRITYLHTPPWDREPWASLLARNSPGGASIDAPVLIAQGEEDSLVLPRITRAFVDRLCRGGETVDDRTSPGVGHVQAGPQTAPDAMDWIGARFAGGPAPAGCGEGARPVAPA